MMGPINSVFNEWSSETCFFHHIPKLKIFIEDKSPFRPLKMMYITYWNLFSFSYTKLHTMIQFSELFPNECTIYGCIIINKLFTYLLLLWSCYFYWHQHIKTNKINSTWFECTRLTYLCILPHKHLSWCFHYTRRNYGHIDSDAQPHKDWTSWSQQMGKKIPVGSGHHSII